MRCGRGLMARANAACQVKGIGQLIILQHTAQIMMASCHCPLFQSPTASAVARDKPRTNVVVMRHLNCPLAHMTSAMHLQPSGGSP